MFFTYSFYSSEVAFEKTDMIKWLKIKRKLEFVTAKLNDLEKTKNTNYFESEIQKNDQVWKLILT
jgi:hypothetical protein